MSAFREQIAFRIYDAGAYCGDCEYTGWDDCSQCRVCVYNYADAVLDLVEQTIRSRQGAAQRRGQYYAEEVDFLRAGGTGDAQILRALNVSGSTLARALHREGRHDIAAPFDRVARAERHGGRAA